MAHANISNIETGLSRRKYALRFHVDVPKSMRNEAIACWNQELLVLLQSAGLEDAAYAHFPFHGVEERQGEERVMAFYMFADEAAWEAFTNRTESLLPYAHRRIQGRLNLSHAFKRRESMAQVAYA